MSEVTHTFATFISPPRTPQLSMYSSVPSSHLTASLPPHPHVLLCDSYTRGSFLQVLAKKRDPVTHVCFLEEVQKTGRLDLFGSVWQSVTRILTQEFAKAAQGKHRDERPEDTTLERC